MTFHNVTRSNAQNLSQMGCNTGEKWKTDTRKQDQEIEYVLKTFLPIPYLLTSFPRCKKPSWSKQFPTFK